MNWRQVFTTSAALELEHLRRNRAFVGLTALAAVSFLVMVSLFGLTGAYAPVALIDLDGGPHAKRLIEAMSNAHHSFNLKFMSEDQAQKLLATGQLVGIITIPRGFSAEVERGGTVPLDVRIDNVNADMTNDVQRALPAAIVAFGDGLKFPGVRVRAAEHDVIPHDTGYIPYLTVSALALDAMIIAGILGALASAREFERKTVKLLRMAPAPQSAVLAGKLSVAATVAAGALLVALLVIVGVYGVHPIAPTATVCTLLLLIAIFTCLGAWLGGAVAQQAGMI